MHYSRKKGHKLVTTNPITQERLIYPKCIKIIANDTPDTIDSRQNSTKYKGPKKTTK